MINFNSSPEASGALGLFEVLGNPEAAKKRLVELQQAQQVADNSLKTLHDANRQFQIDKAEMDKAQAEIADKHASADARLKALDIVETALKARESDLVSREQTVKAQEAIATSTQFRHDTVKTNLDKLASALNSREASVIEREKKIDAAEQAFLAKIEKLKSLAG